MALPALSVSVPSGVEPSMNVTWPVGVPPPGDFAVTVAVKVTGWLKTDERVDAVTVVVVLAIPEVTSEKLVGLIWGARLIPSGSSKPL